MTAPQALRLVSEPMANVERYDALRRGDCVQPQPCGDPSGCGGYAGHSDRLGWRENYIFAVIADL